MFAMPSLVDSRERRPAPFIENLERIAGLEPAAFCMASRRSSQLSYIREVGAGIAYSVAAIRCLPLGSRPRSSASTHPR